MKRVLMNGLLLGVVGIVLAGCSTPRPIDPPLDDLIPAVKLEDYIPPVEAVEVPTLLPLPGQLKPVVNDSIPSKGEPSDPKQRIAQANASARMEPSQKNFVNATQVWPYSEDALYQVYASPERITDIVLQEGEELIAVSAGDTVRWVIGDSTSGGVSNQRVHILVKPTRENLKTNLIVNTNRRTYHLELTSTLDTWIASISWRYPLDQLNVMKAASAKAQAAMPVADGLALERLNFRYEMSGDSPSWKPLRAFDDGEKVYIQFPAGIAQGELPPLFVLGSKGDAQLVNYRVRSPYYIVDRLFSTAELRLGGEKDAQAVRITRVEPMKSAAR